MVVSRETSSSMLPMMSLYSRGILIGLGAYLANTPIEASGVRSSCDTSDVNRRNW